MKILICPHKKFLSSMKFEINKGTDIHIKLSNAWNAKLITPEIINLLINEKSDQKSWKYVFCIFPNPIFFSAYFYAQSENYKISLVDENKKLIKFHKIKIIDNEYNS
ncbi:hypothetical protein SAMN05880566_10426 [Janthinobacterium sp. TND4EL3]|uniref:hypothetical protein n=1 Tax=Janthinobacterium sp. TND4EL3 TaxID=1907311 RepID=UPI000953A942|nr:hypothetical protein [Janthinobacterium sp. TND4EL3]SIQ54218.1 hypothetical protein SAMN05880566_10426 [Janthinobacterium sp. TND4EL3]